ncbi:ATPase [hydrothermal vent metagenome]|uniref:ATPase n=1 Tax=hydrothermal vent metagenome TaxID=652676 RepID=A0A3B0Y4T1_9ZZZZ
MKYKERLLTPRLQRLVQNFPVVVVSGARQVGKSTLLNHVFPAGTDCVVFDPVIDVENARQDPDLFLDNHPATPLLLDEIQYAPELVAAIKRRVDRDRKPGQFVLTGSQQWEVMKSLAESLAGRAVFIEMDGFSLAEMSGWAEGAGWLFSWLEDPEGFVHREHGLIELEYTLYETLWRGFLPDATTLPIEVVADFHEAYIKTYIERDVRLLADVSEWQTFSRFIRLAAALTAQEINYSQLGREIGIAPQTARRWLDMLKATFQWFDVPAFSGNNIKRVSSKPKGFVADTGFACAAQRISSPVALAGHPMLGALFETAVFAEIRKQSALLSPAPQLYHWRSAGGAEVDLLLERDGKLFPIEIKVKSQPARRDVRGIKALRNSYPAMDIQPGLVIAPTRKFMKLSDDAWAMPWNMKEQG